MALLCPGLKLQPSCVACQGCPEQLRYMEKNFGKNKHWIFSKKDIHTWLLFYQLCQWLLFCVLEQHVIMAVWEWEGILRWCKINFGKNKHWIFSKKDIHTWLLFYQLCQWLVFCVLEQHVIMALCVWEWEWEGILRWCKIVQCYLFIFRGSLFFSPWYV